MKLVNNSLLQKYFYKKKSFLLPKTKAIHAKNHFYRKINFLKKNKTMKALQNTPYSRKKPLIFSKTTEISSNKPQYICKLLTTHLI